MRPTSSTRPKCPAPDRSPHGSPYRSPHRSLRRLLFAALLAALAAPAVAQQAETFGPYRVHYNALNTNLLTPDVARSYGIQRAGTRAMLNVTVLDADAVEAIPARITATATNLTGQRRDIELREIREQDAIYYIGTFRVHNEETLNFAVQVSPEGHQGDPFAFDFRQQFFVD